jgi:hypothetical protein
MAGLKFGAFTMLMRLVVGTVLVLLASVPCRGRAVRLWSREEMQKAADVVVVAKPIKSEFVGGKLDGYETSRGVNSTFEVQWTLKGAVDGALVVHHYAFVKGGMIPPNAPSFVSFPVGEKAGSYLLFLKKGADGTYEAVTGQLDPVYSCFVVSGVAWGWMEEPKEAAERARVEWLAGVVRRIAEIRPGVTREEFEKTFVVDGGLSGLSVRRYCYRECRWIKVDVEFEGAKVTKISKPYVETPYED